MSTARITIVLEQEGVDSVTVHATVPNCKLSELPQKASAHLAKIVDGLVPSGLVEAYEAKILALETEITRLVVEPSPPDEPAQQQHKARGRSRKTGK